MKCNVCNMKTSNQLVFSTCLMILTSYVFYTIKKTCVYRENDAFFVKR